MGFGGSAYGANLYGASFGEAVSEVTVANLLPAGPAAIPLDSTVSFSLNGPTNIEAIGAAVFYRSSRTRFIAYELDGFTAPYAPDSSLGGLGSPTVAVSLFEFGGWRDRVASIIVFGVDANRRLFSLEVLS